MRRAKAISLGLAAIFAAQAHSATIVETHGAMKVMGNRIVDKNNIIFQVAGMSLFWSGWMGKYWNAQVVNTLATDWKCGVVRAAMGVEGNGMYLSDPNGNKAMVKAVVDAAIAKGIYVIIDWHDHNAPAHVSQATAFFDEMSKLYGDKPNVIYEIFNEPDDNDTWAGIKSYAETIIPVIRKNTNNLILVGTPNYSQDVDVAAGSPVAGTNIAYALHFYAKTHGAVLRGKANRAMAAGAALFISEWGTTVADGGTSDKAVYTTESDGWLSWAQQNYLSWANWSIADKDEGSAALKGGASSTGGWADGNLTTSGIYVKGKIQAVAKLTFSQVQSVSDRATRIAGFTARTVGSIVSLTLPENASELRILDLQGKVLEHKTLQGQSTLRMALPSAGVVLFQLRTPQGTQSIPVSTTR